MAPGTGAGATTPDPRANSERASRKWLSLAVEYHTMVPGDNRRKCRGRAPGNCGGPAGQVCPDVAIPRPVRSVFQDAVGVDADTWRRGRGWAVALGVALLGGGERSAMIGRRALCAVLQDD